MTLNLLRVVVQLSAVVSAVRRVMGGSKNRRRMRRQSGFTEKRDSLINPRKAQRNWRRTRRTKINQQRKADSTGL